MSPTKLGIPSLFELVAVSATGRCVTLNTQGENRAHNTIHLCSKKGCKKGTEATVKSAKLYIAESWGTHQLGQRLTEGSTIIKWVNRITSAIWRTNHNMENKPQNQHNTMTEVGTKTGHHCMSNILWTTTEIDEERCYRIAHAIKHDSKQDLRSIKGNDVTESIPCQENKVTRVPGLGRFHLLELNEKGAQATQGKGWIQTDPLVCTQHKKELETLLSKSNVCKKPGNCEIKYAQGYWKCKTHNQNLNETNIPPRNERTTKFHPNEVWEDLPSTINKQVTEDLKMEKTWKELWTLAFLWPTAATIPIILLEGEAWMPPYISHENHNDEQEVVVLKYEEGVFRKMKHKTDRAMRPDGQSTYKGAWKMDELSEQMIRILWGFWGPEIEKDKKNNKTWKQLKSQMDMLNMLGTSIGKPTETEKTALMEELTEANNEKPEIWTTALWGKAQAKVQATGIIDSLAKEKDIVLKLKKAMRSEYSQFYGIQEKQLKGLTEDMVNINQNPQDQRLINEFTIEVGEADEKSLLLPEEEKTEHTTTVPNQNSLAHVHNITHASNTITDEQLQKALRQKEQAHEEFIKRRRAEHEKETHEMKEKYEKLLEAAKHASHNNDLTIDQPDEFCKGDDIPEDWVEDVTTFEPFPFNNDLRFQEMMRDGIEPIIGLSDPFKYEEARHSQMISGELVSAYLKQAGDRRILGGDTVGKALKQTIRCELETPALANGEIKTTFDDHALDCMVLHKIGQDYNTPTSVLKGKCTLLIGDVQKVNRPNQHGQSMITQSNKTKSRIESLEDWIRATQAMAEMYCSVYGEAHKPVWTNMIIQLKRFYLNKKVNVDEGDEEFTIDMLTRLSNHLLNQYSLNVRNQARRIAEKSRHFSCQAIWERCKNVPLQIKLPNILAPEKGNGFFRADFLLKKERKITQLWRKQITMANEQQMLAIAKQTISTQVGEKELSMSDMENDIVKWKTAVEAYARGDLEDYEPQTIEAESRRKIRPTLTTQQKEWFRRLENKHPCDEKIKVCLFFNSKQGCQVEDCPYKHVYFQTTRIASEIKGAMALIGGHRTQPEAPLKEVWKKLAEADRKEKLEKMHDNKDNTKQEQKIMIEELRLTAQAGYDIDQLEDERGIKGTEVLEGFKLREQIPAKDQYWWTNCGAEDESRRMQLSLALGASRDFWFTLVFNKLAQTAGATEIAKRCYWNVKGYIDMIEEEKISPEDVAELAIQDSIKEGRPMSFQTPPRYDAEQSWTVNGKCQRRLFNMQMSSHDVGERVTYSIEGLETTESKRCYILSIVAATRGKHTTMSEITREAGNLLLKMRRTATQAETKTLRRIEAIAGEKLDNLQFITTKEPLIQELRIWHSLIEKNHPLALPAPLYAWPEDLARVGIVIISSTPKQTPEIVEIAKGSENTWVILLVTEDGKHITPVSKGVEQQTAFSKTEIEQMTWYQQWNKTSVRNRASSLSWPLLKYETTCMAVRGKCPQLRCKTEMWQSEPGIE